jgi:nicotinamidase/pyrazinamidase
MEKKTGVIVTDVQGDFTTWKHGALAVSGADQAYVEHVRRETERLHAQGHLIFALQDWHPPDHVSFYTNHPGRKPFEVIRIGGREQVLWPPHCVQGTANAALLLDEGLFVAVVQKGKDKRYDSYSGFQDDGGNATDLDRVLKKPGVTDLIIYGLATDYCVRATAFHALEAGYSVTVIEDLSRGISPESTREAVEQMVQRGVTVRERLDL